MSSFQQQHDESIPEAWERFQASSWDGELAITVDFLSRAKH
jgi:hypothetical protein